MLKKLIKSLPVIAGISLLASVMVSCAPTANTADDNKIITKEVTQKDFVADKSSIIGGYAYATYDLNEFAGKSVTIDFSCEMKVENTGTEDANLKWQVNNGGSYPEVVTRIFKPSETDFITVSGKNTTPIEVASNAVLYLSTYQLDTDNLTITVKNIKYKVTYGGSAKEEVAEEEPVEYPTDIFTVGEQGTCGLKTGDSDLVSFAETLVFEASTAKDITYNEDGSVTYIASAAGGAGGGLAFYVKSDKSIINTANYDSVDIDIVCSPVTGKWKNAKANPGFALRLLPYDSTGMFGGFVDVEYFGLDKAYGNFQKTISLDNVADKIIDSSDFDEVLAFGLKFNDYNQGLADGDQLKVQIKKITFNKKEGAPADSSKSAIPEEYKGKVLSIEYPSRDYTVDADNLKDEDYFNKHAWVYLPAGYDSEDTATRYPLFILLHGFGQNENTWGLSDKTEGKIKGYMDRGMADGSVKKFILVCVTGVADKSWGPDGAGNSVNGFNAFGGELKEKIIPYMREHYNVADGRDNVALAGLSMGGGQTFNAGIKENLDLISYFGAFSAATFVSSEEYMNAVEENYKDDTDLKVNLLYMICGTADSLVIDGYNDYSKAMKTWNRIEKFECETVEGGTHDFPVWYKGFKNLIPLLFK